METPTQLSRILIVDESRIARAMLVKHLRDRFECREEADGEAAWQVLVLDHSIQLVICSLSLPVLDGNDFLIRVRASRLPRLYQMPMLMIAGDDDEALERAKTHGASDFISRSTGAAELLGRIDSLLKLAHAQNLLKDNLEQNVQNAETGLFTRKYIEAQADQAVSHALRHESEISVIVMGFDNISVLREEHGVDVVKQLQQRFTAMLASKIRKEDSLGHFAGSQLIVVSPGTPYPACESFGNRLREAIHVANIIVHGQRLNLSVSVGVSNIPIDTVASGGALIELAGARLKAAQQSGGNRVISCRVQPSRATVVPRIDHAIALIQSGHENEVVPHLAKLGKQILPLLKLLERRLKLGLHMADIEQCLLDLTQDEEDDGQG
ncbi:diguanylate cyclase [Propionivibrio sp.]|uniref:diguanylate cyclase n=1 Tax=Propionivibrio sp. TaxID=2212460 RepID=UPI0026268FE4|nr:diguanylate cyclase [Propionivibrio sp.]